MRREGCVRRGERRGCVGIDDCERAGRLQSLRWEYRGLGARVCDEAQGQRAGGVDCGFGGERGDGLRGPRRCELDRGGVGVGEGVECRRRGHVEVCF